MMTKTMVSFLVREICGRVSGEKGGLLPRYRRGSSWSGLGGKETHYWETLGVGGGGWIGAIPSRKDPVPLPSIRRNTICDILLKW